MPSSVILALFLLLLFGAGAWGVLRFGAAAIPDEVQRRMLAAGVAGCGVLAAVLAVVGGFESSEVPAFTVTTELNQGAVSYAFFIEHTDREHELRVQPQRDAGHLPEGALTLRIILTAPGNVTLINESVQIAIAETDIVQDDGTTVRGVDWAAWSQRFSPTAAGFYEIALSLPPGSPRVRLRVGTPEPAGD